MNILVVEDEQEVRKGIVSLLREWQTTAIVDEAENGARALGIMEQNMVDIVLTDIRMPEIDGLQLLDLIRKRFPETMVIMLSAHPDFTYVQKAMSLGASDYLLKPIGAPQLKEVTSKAMAAIQKRNETKYTARHHQRIVMQNALRDLMNQVPVYYVNYELEQELERTGFVLVYLSARRQTGSSSDKLFWYSVQNMFEELMSPCLLSNPFFIAHYLGQFVVLPHRQGEPFPDLASVIKSLQLEASKVLKAELSYWHSRPYDSLNQLAGAYQEFQKEYYRTQHHGSERHTEFIVALQTAVKNRNEEQTAALVTDYLLQPELALEQAKEYAVEISLILMKETDVLDTSLKIEMKRKMPPIKAIMDMASKSEVLEALLAGLKQLIALFRKAWLGERHYAIQKVLGYIHEHISSDFTLKDVADRIYLNESYLSTLFKSEMGQTFSEYVLQLRMKKASALLLTSDVSIQEISQMVGYPNYGYFGQVFRKFHGCSPSSYRRQSTGESG